MKKCRYIYYVEKDELENIKEIKIPQKEPYYQGGGGRIASQDSILFSVPIEHLRKGLKIYVEFSYEWELTKSGNISNEPHHRVYFRGGDILVLQIQKSNQRFVKSSQPREIKLKKA